MSQSQPVRSFRSLNVNKRLLLFTALLLVACSAAAWALLYDGGSKLEAAAAVRPVKIVTVENVDPVRSIELPALIEASRSTDLTFEVSGSLETLLVEPGENVSEGQIIARLDRRMFNNELATMQAQYDNARTEHQRAERLVAEDALSRSVFEQRETELAVASAALATAKIKLEDTVLRAPFSGVISDVVVDRFENVGPGIPIATLQTRGDAEAVVQVPAAIVANSGQIEPLSATLTLDAAPERGIPATPKSITTQANPQTQSFEVRFNFTPPEGLIVLPGMTGTVRSQLSLGDTIVDRDAVAIPFTAIQSKDGKHYVWVVHPQTMKVTRREIEIGRDFGEKIPVTNGLHPGEQIVATGAEYLQAGMTVRNFEPESQTENQSGSQS